MFEEIMGETGRLWDIVYEWGLGHLYISIPVMIIMFWIVIRYMPIRSSITNG